MIDTKTDGLVIKILVIPSIPPPPNIDG